MKKSDTKDQAFEQLKEHMNSENVTSHLYYFFKHMPSDDDQIVSILKGHLLLEEILEQLINVEVIKPSALKDSRLSFYQVVCIAESLLWHQGSEWVWTSLKKLNKLRNSLSHELKPKDVEKNINGFLKSVEKLYPPHGKKEMRLRPNQRLLFSIGLVYADLAAYLEACRNSKALS